MDHIITTVGAIAMVAGGLLLAAGLLCAASYAVGWLGAKVFYKLRRTYHLSVIGYWLDRMEREGLRTFQRPDPPHDWGKTELD